MQFIYLVTFMDAFMSHFDRSAAIPIPELHTCSFVYQFIRQCYVGQPAPRVLPTVFGARNLELCH